MDAIEVMKTAIVLLLFCAANLRGEQGPEGFWGNTGALLVFQADVTDLLLPNGKVLVIDSGAHSAELYDPATEKWTVTNPMSAFRVHYSATLLRDGKVLVAGGAVDDYVTTAQLYDPLTETWT